MSLSRVATCYDLSEALVVVSLLRCHGMKATVSAHGLGSQRWDLIIALGGLDVLTATADAEAARGLIAQGEPVAGHASWQSDAFWSRPIRNGLFAGFALLLLSGIWPVWISTWRRPDVSATVSIAAP